MTGLTAPHDVHATDAAPHDPALTDPVWFYRVNPFVRARLSDPALETLADQVRHAELEVAQAADLAGSVLHRLVGEARTDSRRKALLATSRAIRKVKRLPEGPHPEEVDQWQQALTQRQTLLDRFHEAHRHHVAGERKELARQLTDPALRSSLELVAPEVARQAGRYVETVAADGTGPKRLLKAERGLIQYVMRAAVRTSPLAQLTAVGLTHGQPGGSHPDTPIILQERSICSLDRVMLDYVVGGALQTDDLLGADPHLTVPPTGAVDADRIYVLHNGTQGWQRVSVPLRRPLRQLIDALAMGPVRHSAILAHLQETIEVDKEAAEQIVSNAVSAGLVYAIKPTTDSDTLNLDSHASSTLADTLPTVASGLDDLATAPASRRRSVLEGIEAALGDLSRGVGRPARVSVTEDRFVEMAPVDPTAWGDALDDLGPAVELLATFDWLADVGIALTDAFVSRHGAGGTAHLVQIAPELVADVTHTAERMTSIYVRSSDDPSVLEDLGGSEATLAQLYDVRRRVEAMFHNAVDHAIQNDLEEVCFDPRALQQMLSGTPARLRERPLGYGVLVQSLGDRLVINDGLPGHGMLYSRFLGPDRSLGGDTLERLRTGLQQRYDEPGATLVEDRSHHGMNVNVHPPVLEDVLEPQDWPRLTLRHDADTNRLHVLDGHTRIKVLPIGGGHPGLYPPPLSVASGLTIAGRLYNGLPDTWADRDTRDRSLTRRVPRVLVGRVVINRARWYPGTDLDEALNVADEAERLLAVTRWRARHAVPREVVVKSAPADNGPASVGAPEGQATRSRSKPQYVDLASALCIRVLPRMLQRRAGDDAPPMYLEEAAPGVVDDTHAHEWVVEVNRPAQGHFRYGGNP